MSTNWKRFIADGRDALPLVTKITAARFAHEVANLNPLYSGPTLLSASRNGESISLVYRVGYTHRGLDRGERAGMPLVTVGYVVFDVDSGENYYDQVESASEWGCIEKILEKTQSAPVHICETITGWSCPFTQKSIYTNGWDPNAPATTYRCSCEGRAEEHSFSPQSLAIRTLCEPENHLPPVEGSIGGVQ